MEIKTLQPAAAAKLPGRMLVLGESEEDSYLISERALVSFHFIRDPLKTEAMHYNVYFTTFFFIASEMQLKELEC